MLRWSGISATAPCCSREGSASLVITVCIGTSDIRCIYNLVSFFSEAIPGKLWHFVSCLHISRIGAGDYFLRILSMVIVSGYPVDSLSGHRKYLHPVSNLNCPLQIKISANRQLQAGFWIWVLYIYTHFKYWLFNHRLLFHCCIFTKIRCQPPRVGRRLGHVESKGQVFVSQR